MHSQCLIHFVIRPTMSLRNEHCVTICHKTTKYMATVISTIVSNQPSERANSKRYTNILSQCVNKLLLHPLRSSRFKSFHSALQHYNMSLFTSRILLVIITMIFIQSKKRRRESVTKIILEQPAGMRHMAGTKTHKWRPPQNTGNL